MPELKCFLCEGAIVQDKILTEQNMGSGAVRYDGCHCIRCGIKFKPNLDELIKLFEHRRKANV